jgi:hypothetical protein
MADFTRPAVESDSEINGQVIASQRRLNSAAELHHDRRATIANWEPVKSLITS